jgi:hypothetical protein
MGQIVRALEEQGPQTPVELQHLVGATYWDHDRFERALAFAVADGLVTRTADDLLQAI